MLGYDPAGPGPDSRLEDCREAFRQREQALVENYEHKIEELRREIRGLRELSDTLKEQIKDKNAIISFLRGQKSDNG